MDEKKKPIKGIEWLGYRRVPDFTKSRPLGGFIGVVLTLLAAIIAFLAAMALFRFSQAVVGIDIPNHEAIRNIGLVVAALVGVPFIIWRSVVAQEQVVVAQKQVNVAEQSHITDRISKAVEQLGAEKTVKYHRTNEEGVKLYENDSNKKPDFKKPIFSEETKPNIEVRLGGIYALERISKDSLPDHIQIMEILCAYIRENAPASGAAKPDFDLPQRPDDVSDETAMDTYYKEMSETYGFGGPMWAWAQTLKPRHDIQAAITVIKRRDERLRDHETAMVSSGQLDRVPLDLRDTCLQGADMSRGHFDNAQFDDASLDGANLDKAEINWAQLNGAQLNRANLYRAELNHVWLNGAELNGAVCNGAQLNGAWLEEAEFNGANLYRAELKGANLYRAELNGADCTGAELNGAWLEEAEFNGAMLKRANFTGADTKFAAVKSTDLTTCVDLSVDQVNSMFGDASTTLPDGMDRPQHWPQTDLEYEEFLQLWQAAKDKAGMS